LGRGAMEYKSMEYKVNIKQAEWENMLPAFAWSPPVLHPHSVKIAQLSGSRFQIQEVNTVSAVAWMNG